MTTLALAILLSTSPAAAPVAAPATFGEVMTIVCPSPWREWNTRRQHNYLCRETGVTLAVPHRTFDAGISIQVTGYPAGTALVTFRR